MFEDDGQISELKMRKHELGRIVRAETLRPSLLEALDGGEEFLHVLVDEASDQEVVV